MPQNRLHGSKVRPAIHHMSRKTVAELVGMDVRKTGALAGVADNLPNALTGELCTPSADK
jgi:hypothetical protein